MTRLFVSFISVLVFPAIHGSLLNTFLQQKSAQRWTPVTLMIASMRSCNLHPDQHDIDQTSRDVPCTYQETLNTFLANSPDQRDIGQTCRNEPSIYQQTLDASPANSENQLFPATMTCTPAQSFEARLYRTNYNGRLTKMFKKCKTISPQPSHVAFDNSRSKSRCTNRRECAVVDNTRVHVQTPTRGMVADFIAANWVDSFTQQGAYIVAECPMAHTAAAFWHMIWQTGAHVIAMTTNWIAEDRSRKDRRNCFKYMPEPAEDGTTELEFGKFTITHIEETTDSGDEDFFWLPFEVTQLRLVNRESPVDQGRTIVHMRYRNWRAYTAPDDVDEFLEFRRRVKAANVQASVPRGIGASQHPPPPIVVHSARSIGRAGTFVAADVMIDRWEATGCIDPMETVNRLQQQRKAVQNVEQFAFCAAAVQKHREINGDVKEVRPSNPTTSSQTPQLTSHRNAIGRIHRNQLLANRNRRRPSNPTMSSPQASRRNSIVCRDRDQLPTYRSFRRSSNLTTPPQTSRLTSRQNATGHIDANETADES